GRAAAVHDRDGAGPHLAGAGRVVVAGDGAADVLAQPGADAGTGTGQRLGSAVMQVQLRRCAARRELAAATRRRSQELVSGTTKINRIIFWKALTRDCRRRIVGTQRRWFESKISQGKRPCVSPE